MLVAQEFSALVSDLLLGVPVKGQFLVIPSIKSPKQACLRARDKMSWEVFLLIFTFYLQEYAVRDYISRSIFFFPIFYFWFWKIKSFFLTSPFYDYTSTMYSSFLSTLIIWVTSTKCSLTLREFLYHRFWYPDARTRLI